MKQTNQGQSHQNDTSKSKMDKQVKQDGSKTSGVKHPENNGQGHQRTDQHTRMDSDEQRQENNTPYRPQR